MKIIISFQISFDRYVIIVFDYICVLLSFC